MRVWLGELGRGLMRKLINYVVLANPIWYFAAGASLLILTPVVISIVV